MKLHRLPSDGQRDVAVFGAVDVLGLEALDELDRLGDARLEIGEGLLLVGVARHLGAGEPRRGSLGEIGYDLHLAGKGKHVGREPPVEHHLGSDLMLGGEGFRLVQDGGEVLQHGKKNRH